MCVTDGQLTVDWSLSILCESNIIVYPRKSNNVDCVMESDGVLEFCGVVRSYDVCEDQWRVYWCASEGYSDYWPNSKDGLSDDYSIGIILKRNYYNEEAIDDIIDGLIVWWYDDSVWWAFLIQYCVTGIDLRNEMKANLY